ncbi:YbaK/EbsC family protein [Agromyces sp. M3QZ16-3]|uniref:hypothetical protein n=1 Tax=Agromyces sp. M3QZ16-3 TaxID=3447585 RepID=UPI003F69088E
MGPGRRRARFGSLDFGPALDAAELLAAPTLAALRATDAAADVLVAAIDPGLADTAAFCEHHGISMSDGANCVIVQARRGERSWNAACLVRGSKLLVPGSFLAAFPRAEVLALAQARLAGDGLRTPRAASTRRS